MYLGFGAILLLGFGWWLIWSKLCDIEKRQFKIQEEVDWSSKYLIDQLHLTQSMIERLHKDMPPVSLDENDKIPKI
ncbi:hypothetical protein Q4O66_03375 [Acinetobacter baumannii]|uniref:hypothetical protein n=1 Tax=Acinetobacter baumannii TaxID=470 RepID=UPI0026E087A5|nr:hypothetical protein [Acinetobacter baumannii]MDO5884964.1 hypothetical protein [Acinetobacter baumannii]